MLFRQNDYNHLGSSEAQQLGSSATLQIRQLDNLAAWIFPTVYRQRGSLASWQFGSLGNRQRGILLADLQLGEVPPGINPIGNFKGLSISVFPPREVLKSYYLCRRLLVITGDACCTFCKVIASEHQAS